MVNHFTQEFVVLRPFMSGARRLQAAFIQKYLQNVHFSHILFPTVSLSPSAACNRPEVLSPGLYTQFLQAKFPTQRL